VSAYPGSTRPSGALAAVLLGLGASLGALAAAPAIMPAGYSWLSQTTSESAAQGVPGAWLARLGFVLFGVSVLGLVACCRQRWGWPAACLHGAFGVLMVAAGVFSHRPWMAGYDVDRVEDLLHSIAASSMGIAFALGVVATALARSGRRGRTRVLDGRVLDGMAVMASVVIPLAMTLWPQAQGALQRLMFLVAYSWYAVEAGRALLLTTSRGPRGSTDRGVGRRGG
jgi:hypothetical protein